MNKIKDDELRRIVAEDSNEQVGVIIELDLPHPQVKVGQVNRGGVIINIPLAVSPYSEEEEDAIEKRIAEAREFLEETLTSPPRWLRAAHSFVARVTPEQIRTIATKPFIKAIWPNRGHQTILPTR